MCENDDQIITIGSLADEQTAAQAQTCTQMHLPKKPSAAFVQFKTDQVGNKWKELSADELKKYTDAYQKDKESGIARPKCAYFRFIDDQQISKKWAELDAVAKQTYKNNFTNLQKQYVEDMRLYNEIYEKKVLNAPLLPKRRPVPTAFTFYCKAIRAKDSENAKTDGELYDLWNAIDENEKKIYTDMQQAEQDLQEARIQQYELEWGNIQYIIATREEAGLESYYEGEEPEQEEQEEEEEEEATTSVENCNVEELSDRPAEQPRPKKVARKSESSDDFPKQKEQTEKSLQLGYNLYCKHTLQTELEKFTRKVTKANNCSASATDQLFSCNEILQDVQKRWDKLSDRTRANWIRQAANTSNVSKARRDASDDDEEQDIDDADADADIPTPNNETDDENYAAEISNGEEEEGNDGEQEAEDEDEDDDDKEEEEEEQEEDKQDEDDEEEGDENDKVVSLDKDDEDSRENDIKNYGDDGDDFVCGDDEVEYEDGVTSEDIRASKEKEKIVHEALSLEFQGKNKKKK